MEEAAVDIILPVLEAAVVYASHYCKSCGRSLVTSEDMEYGLKYAAMTTVGKHLGTHFPEVWDNEDSDTEEEYSEEEDESFTRYEGEDETCMKMNESFDIWETWEPESPAEQAIKNAIDKQKEEDGRIHPE